MRLGNLSLKQMITASAVGLFAAGMVIMVSITAVILWGQSRDRTALDLAGASALIEATFKEMSGEVQTYASMLARHPDVGEALASDAASLGVVLAREYGELRKLDPQVGALEVLSPAGVVIRRGHNPTSFGDNKAQQGVVRAGMQAGGAAALTISPASRQISTAAIRPLTVAGKLSGYVMVGKRMDGIVLERIAQLSGADIVVLHKGALVATTRVDVGADQAAALEAAISAAPGDLLNIAAGAGRSLIGRVTTLPLDDGASLHVIAALDRSVIAAKFRAAVTWPLIGGLIALLVVVPLVLVAAKRFSGMIDALARAMRTLAGGETNVEIPHGERSDEIGGMAKAIAVFRENGVKVREADSQRERETLQRAERLAAIEAVNADISRVIGAAVAGRLTERVAADKAPSDLIGLVEAINHLLDGLESTISRTVAGLESMATGDLDARIDDTENGDFRRLTLAANTLAEGLKGVVGGMITASSDVKLATDEIQSGVTDLAARTAQQADISAETTARLAAFAATFRETSQMTGAVARKAGQTEQQAHSGEELVQRVRDTMGRISSSSRRIADITTIIDDVAFQTNLLALNASVEAARAGEAGRGFAVVASEVRTLAQRAADASRDVKQLIEQAVDEVSEGERAVAETDAAFRDIASAIQQIAEEVRVTAGNAERQAGAVGSLSAEIERLGDMTQQNAALVEEADAMLVRTNSRINDLVGLAEQFKRRPPAGMAHRRAA
jgi:methyl-accepting chemotaxis protein